MGTGKPNCQGNAAHLLYSSTFRSKQRDQVQWRGPELMGVNSDGFLGGFLTLPMVADVYGVSVCVCVCVWGGFWFGNDVQWQGETKWGIFGVKDSLGGMVGQLVDIHNFKLQPFGEKRDMWDEFCCWAAMHTCNATRFLVATHQHTVHHTEQILQIIMPANTATASILFILSSTRTSSIPPDLLYYINIFKIYGCFRK